MNYHYIPESYLNSFYLQRNVLYDKSEKGDVTQLWRQEKGDATESYLKGRYYHR